MLRIVKLLICIAILCAPAHAQYVKSKQGLLLWIDGYDMIRKAYMPNTPLTQAYPLEMMVRFCEVVWLPLHNNKRIKCWVFYDNSMNWTLVKVLTLDKHNKVKCILRTTGDDVDISQWRRGRFATYLLNREPNMIWGKQNIAWSIHKQCFTKSIIMEDTCRQDKMSLSDIFGCVRITFTLANGRWRSDMNTGEESIRFTPTGYVRKRLPLKYRDMPCVQAKLSTPTDHMKDRSFYLSKCNINDEVNSKMDWHYGDGKLH